MTKKIRMAYLIVLSLCVIADFITFFTKFCTSASMGLNYVAVAICCFTIGLWIDDEEKRNAQA